MRGATHGRSPQGTAQSQGREQNEKLLSAQECLVQPHKNEERNTQSQHTQGPAGALQTQMHENCFLHCKNPLALANNTHTHTHDTHMWILHLIGALLDLKGGWSEPFRYTRERNTHARPVETLHTHMKMKH